MARQNVVKYEEDEMYLFCYRRLRQLYQNISSIIKSLLLMGNRWHVAALFIIINNFGVASYLIYFILKKLVQPKISLAQHFSALPGGHDWTIRKTASMLLLLIESAYCSAEWLMSVALKYHLYKVLPHTGTFPFLLGSSTRTIERYELVQWNRCIGIKQTQDCEAANHSFVHTSVAITSLCYCASD